MNGTQTNTHTQEKKNKLYPHNICTQIFGETDKLTQFDFEKKLKIPFISRAQPKRTREKKRKHIENFKFWLSL